MAQRSPIKVGSIVRAGRVPLLMCLAVLVMAACTPPSAQTKAAAIPALVKIKIDDPIIHDLATATQSAEVSASGEFTPGIYLIKNAPVKIEPGTHFTLRLKVPIENPNFISTEKASGILSTSRPLMIKGFPVPETVELKNGRAKGDVDILNTVGVFCLNVLEDQFSTGSGTTDVRKMISSVHVEHAILALRPGSFYKVGEKQLHIGSNSSLELNDISIDSGFNLDGTCILHLTFLPNSQWIGERTDWLFEGGKVNTKLLVHRVNNQTTLTLPDRKQKLELEDVTFKWGKNKKSSAHSQHCELNLQELEWQKMHASAKPLMHLLAKMLLTNTHVTIETDTQITNAQFPETVPAQLKLDWGKDGHQTQFNTYNTEIASVGMIEINRPTTNLKIYLTDASIGPINLDKLGELQFSLAHGTAHLKRLDWSTAKRTFTLATAGASTLTLPEGMELSLTGKNHSAKMSLPINVRLGSATLTGASEKMKLGNLNGALLVKVDNDVRISSDMDFSIEDSSLLGKYHVEVHARGLDLHSTLGKAVAHIKSCGVELSDAALEDAISDEMPHSKSWKIDKMFPQQEWRYRDATITVASVKNLKLNSMAHDSANVIHFTAQGDVQCDGTVEKGSFITAIKHSADPDKWETKPWTATGHVTGTGVAKYKLLPGNSLATSKLAYDLSMTLPIPDDVDLDWSRVNDGLLKHTEHAMIVGQMKKLKVPLQISGKLSLCDPGETQWRGVKISNFVATPTDVGAKLTFVAEAVF